MGKESMPLECIQLNVTFDQPDNFRKEPLTFEVVEFPGVDHALSRMIVLRQIHGCPQLHLLEVEDAWPQGSHDRRGQLRTSLLL